jgi:hypothetical protein
MFRYEDSLLNIMYEFGPRPHLALSEIEVFIGDILGKTGALMPRQRDLCISMKDRFEDVMSYIVKWIRGNEDVQEEADCKTDQVTPGVVLGLSKACLWVAINEEPKVWESGKNKVSKLRSFGYVAAGICVMVL